MSDRKRPHPAYPGGVSNRVAAVATRPLRAVPEFLRGVALLGRGFAFWSVRPGLMALGLLPAVLVGAGLITVIALLGTFLQPITSAATFFAEAWDSGWRGALQLLVAIALIIATLALAARVFTALTLLVGAPFYDRIQRACRAATCRRIGLPARGAASATRRCWCCSRSVRASWSPSSA